MSSLDIIQWTAVALGIAEVLLASVNKVWLYPTGIASILLSVYVLLVRDLYADCLLHFYYLIMSIYGWIYWNRRQNKSEVRVTFSSKTDWIIVLVISFGGWILLYLFLVYFTPSNTPVLDSWVSATGCAGMWLLARRKVENWVLLNVSNAFAIPLLIYKDVYIMAGFTGFLFIVACFGYFKWKRLAYAVR
jgi:nicotinamide mononucleotide transporter